MAPSSRAWLFVTVAIVAAFLPAIPAAQDPAAPIDLRKAVQKALDKRWKSWTVAPLTCSHDGQPSGAAPILDGDYNSDGAPDAAFVLTTDKGARLVVAINRIEDVDVYEVDALPADVAVSVNLRRRGTKYFRKDMAVDQYFGADALTVSPCAGSGDTVAYIFTGAGFRRE
ncbi:MAG TPA: hypothetical protein VFV98_06080, partial [Vicinamibacterales bacterium]|nr:hypothetical protein [Vicinamibacterales bacterium]